MALAIIFALLSANLNALSAVLQRRATGQVRAGDLFRRQIVTVVLRNKLWLAGIGLQVAGWFAQALALHNGSLVLVEPLLITDILFLLVYLHFFMAAHIGRQGFAGVGLLIVGLSCLLVVADPHSGQKSTDGWSWLLAIGVVGGIIALAAVVMRRSQHIPARSILAGFAAGLHFSFTAALTKLVLEQLQFGVWHTLGTWQLWTLTVVGISAALTMQSMYGAGPLALTQPALEITEALAGIQFGIILFGETINTSAGALTIEAFSGLLAAAGITLLARNKALQQQTNHALAS